MNSTWYYITRNRIQQHCVFTPLADFEKNPAGFCCVLFCQEYVLKRILKFRTENIHGSMRLFHV